MNRAGADPGIIKGGGGGGGGGGGRTYSGAICIANKTKSSQKGGTPPPPDLPLSKRPEVVFPSKAVPAQHTDHEEGPVVPLH